MSPWARPRTQRPSSATTDLRDTTDVHLFARSLASTCMEADGLSSHCEGSSHITHPGNSLEQQNHFCTDGGKWVIVVPCHPGPFTHLTLQVDNTVPCARAGSVRHQPVAVGSRKTHEAILSIPVLKDWQGT